jgi:hypothetical protein
MRTRLLSLVVAGVLLFGAAARADSPPSRARWIPVGILYAVSATGASLFAYGTYQIENAPNARTLGLYHAAANTGSTLSGVGAAMFGLGAIGGTMVMLMAAIIPSRSSRRAQLVPTGNGVGVVGVF